jgi:polyisoprenoid-binding protein YceI
MLVALLALAVSGVQAADFDIDVAHSNVGFRIRHLVSKTTGRFDKFSGTVSFDKDKPADLKANVVIQTASVNTDNEKRDTHLKSADFFNVEKFPTMTFKSTGAKKTADDKIQLTGDLTMLGVTKPVTLDVTVGGVMNDPWGGTRSGFSATGKLNRKDFGMVYNMTMDKGGLMLGDDVELVIEVEGVQSKPGKK